jgi:hypothetical protein
VLTGTEKEDMAVCFPEHSSFHLGGEVYLRAEKEEITLKQGAIEMCFPLIRKNGSRRRKYHFERRLCQRKHLVWI